MTRDASEGTLTVVTEIGRANTGAPVRTPIESRTAPTHQDGSSAQEPTVLHRPGGRPPRGRVAPLPTAPEPHRYTIGDLEAATGFNQRTIRYYIAQGLLAPAHGRGPSATYGLGHLLRLRMIALLKAAYRPLEEIRARLAELSDGEIAAMLEIEIAPPEDRWRRVQLHPDIELHVRERASGAGRGFADAVDLIVGLARPVIDRLDDPT